MPRSLGDLVRPRPALLPEDLPVRDAVRMVLAEDLSALPVVDREQRLLGIFGERDFITALFPGYLSELSTASFVPKSIDRVIEKRVECRREPVKRWVSSEHVDVTADYSDVHLAELFLHHRVLIVPVLDEERRVVGVIKRADFFEALADRFLTLSPEPNDAESE